MGLTTLFLGQPYCLELTLKGWRVTSLRHDCMQGDYTRLDLFTVYYDTLYDLMDKLSPDYRNLFSEKLAQKLRMLQVNLSYSLDKYFIDFILSVDKARMLTKFNFLRMLIVTAHFFPFFFFSNWSLFLLTIVIILLSYHKL